MQAREEKQESEYRYIEPSLKRHKVDPFIAAEHNHPIWRAIWHFYIRNAIKRRFYSIRVKHPEHFDMRNKDYPCIFYAQHTCWWDGLIGYCLYWFLFKEKTNMMIEDLLSFPLLKYVGAFSIDKKSPKSILRSMQYSVEFMKNEKISLWMFPQGVIKPPNHRPLEFQKGLAFLVQKTGKVNLIPIAMQYPFLRQGLPEVMVDIGKPIIVDKDIDKDEFTDYVEKDFTNLLDNQLKEISNGEIEKYNTFLFKKHAGLGKSLEKFLKNSFRLFNE